MPAGVIVWADYTKDRSDFFAERVNELRNRGRQLAAAVGVVIGLEITLLGRLVLDVDPPFNVWLFASSLVVLFIALGYQLSLLSRLFEAGYSWEKITGGPESPTNEKLKETLWKSEEEEAKKALAFYYADTADQFYRMSEKLALDGSIRTVPGGSCPASSASRSARWIPTFCPAIAN